MSSTALARGAAPIVRGGRHAGLVRAIAVSAPLVALAVYAVALIPRVIQFSAATFLMADAPAPAYLAPQAGAHLAVHTEMLPTILDSVLVGLPGGHLAIQLLGPLLALLTVALLCWSVAQLRGSWLTTAVAALAAGPVLLWSILFPSAHVYTFLSAALLASAVCAIALGRPRLRLLVGVGVAAGVALIGDQGFLAIGMVPLALAGGGLWVARRRLEDVAAVAIILAIAATLAVTGEAVLRAMGVTLVGDAFFGSTGLGRVPIGTGLLGAAHMLGDIVGGQWSGWGGSNLGQPWRDLALAAGCAVPLVAPGALAVQLRRRVETAIDAARIAYLFFWTAADLLVLGVYVLYGYSENGLSAHYLLPCFLAAVAALPFIVPARRSVVPGLVAAALALVQAAGVATVPAADFSGLHPPTDGPRVVAAIEAAGLTKGYADYWEAHPLTWMSGERVRVYPVDVEACTANSGAPNICRYMYADDSWYAPVPGPTFLVVRTGGWPCVSWAPARVLGAPERIITVDAQTSILVYGYDIATRTVSNLVSTSCAN